MAKKGRRATNEERFTAIQMYDNGLTADQISEILNVGRSSSSVGSRNIVRVGSLHYPQNLHPVARLSWMTVR
jgi:hypothetical protein